jgi:pimeloyl-ACP methyl ester carboxylesterase
VLKPKLAHLVVVLPGISGSVLQDKQGRSVWDASHRFLWTVAASLGGVVRELRFTGVDSGGPLHPDGVKAIDLIADAHLILGLSKIDGYTDLLNAIRDSFDEVIDCLPDDGQVGNLLRFPYDWRRDNRITARILKKVIDEKLVGWQKATNNPAAKVILVAHSMGGLVSRYYLEKLDGWKSARALITMGTPFRGSLNALNYLANGYKQFLLDLTAAMRSFPSVYQLLPAYQAVFDGKGDCYVGDCLRLDAALAPGIDRVLVDDARSFHDEINTAVAANNRDHGIARYLTIPVVGTRQPTNQLAVLTNQRMGMEREKRPAKIAAEFDGGDGTVPMASAIPIEQSENFSGWFVAECHGALQKNVSVLSDLIDRLKQLQGVGLDEVRGTVEAAHLPGALCLALEDAYVDGEPVRIAVEVQGGNPGEPVCAKVTSLETGRVESVTFTSTGDRCYITDLSHLPFGTYRIRAEVPRQTAGIRPVQDLFAVCQRLA